MTFALAWNADAAGADLAASAGLGDDLTTAVIISLFTDRLAEADDPLPMPGADRRGWWADTLPPGRPPGDLTGSRLWLLARAKATEDTRQSAIAYVREALQWMLDDGVAAEIDVTAQWGGLGRLDMAVAIYRQSANGPAPNPDYAFAWTQQVGG